MVRKIIEIDEDRCNGCGLCAEACHEGAIGMVDGKARLLRDDYCDGLGDCLPACPVDAIHFVEREAAAYDHEAVQASMAAKAQTAPPQVAAHAGHSGHGCACPGSSLQMHAPAAPTLQEEEPPSQLAQWPVQIKLVPTSAPFFNGAKLLIAADCAAYAHAAFHQTFMQGCVTLIGCPKLDDVDYTEKLAAILRDNDVKSITVVRMEVPCCRGMEEATRNALQASGKRLPFACHVLSTKGDIVL